MLEVEGVKYFFPVKLENSEIQQLHLEDDIAATQQQTGNVNACEPGEGCGYDGCGTARASPQIHQLCTAV